MKRTKRTAISRAPRSKIDPQDFLLEIGCEEIPADYLPWVLDWEFPRSLGLSSAYNLLSEKGILWKQVQSFGTPRRLVLKVSGVEPEVHEEVEGPPLSVAFDAQGKPSRAAEAFAQRQGVKLSQLSKKETSRGPRLVLKRAIPVMEVLALAVPEIIQKIGFPKTMRWDASGVRFARPIRWLVALYGPQVVLATFGTLKAGRETYPNRRLGDEQITVKNVSSYFSLLPKLGVQLEEGLSFRRENNGEPDKLNCPKKEALYKRLQATVHRLGGRLPNRTSEEFDWLLTTATFLSEQPVVAEGSFRSSYLDLPVEVLAASMAKNLKLFTVFSPDGKELLPKFLAVLEGAPANRALVVQNIERILEAKFADARFFYREDTRTSLEAKVKELGKVVFHERLGSVAERIPRLERLISAIDTQVNLPAEAKRALSRAAQLCKADLVTQLVREFPSLQGVIGAHYANHDGEPEAVTSAVREHYRPRGAGDSVPTTLLGAVLGLADRLDTLVCYFGVGLKPTGSADPYGLRRQALGLVRILIEPPPKVSFVGLSIDRLLDEGIQSWGSKITVDSKTLKKELRAFLRERFEWLAFVQRKIGRKLVEAVLAADENEDDLSSAWERLTILHTLWTDSHKKSSLLKAAKVAERTGRIVKAAREEDGLGSVKPEIFRESSEKKLWEIWNHLCPTVLEQVKRRQYAQAVVTYSSLYPQIHEFFESVFVMDENLQIRRNRLALMNEIFKSLAGHFADLSKLPLAGVEVAG